MVASPEFADQHPEKARPIGFETPARLRQCQTVLRQSLWLKASEPSEGLVEKRHQRRCDETAKGSRWLSELRNQPVCIFRSCWCKALDKRGDFGGCQAIEEEVSRD
jgi:hypothetical protein